MKLWECTIEFSADGQSDSFTSRHRAATEDDALAANLAAAEAEYGGGWDDISSHTARVVG